MNIAEQNFIRQAVNLYLKSCKTAGLQRQILSLNLCEISIEHIILRNPSGEVAIISFCKTHMSIVLAGIEYKSLIRAKRYLDCNYYNINPMDKTPIEKRLLSQAIDLYYQTCFKNSIDPKPIIPESSEVGLKSIFLNNLDSEVVRIRYNKTHLYFELDGVIYNEPIKL